MANQTITLSSETAKGLVSLLEKMATYEEGIRSLRYKILTALPESFFQYGSRLWWEKEECLVDEDIKKGRVSRAYDNVDKLLKDLNKGILRKK